MTLREKIENNLTLAMFGFVAAGFTAGIAAYQTVLAIAQVEYLSKAKLEQLHAAAAACASASAAPAASTLARQIEVGRRCPHRRQRFGCLSVHLSRRDWIQWCQA
jgi:hypothetical protein